MSEELSQDVLDMMMLFYPEYLQRRQEMLDRNGRFVYYTSADTAMRIIRNQEVWLRNTRSMNDYSEVTHGANCFYDAFVRSDAGKSLQAYLDSRYPGFAGQFAKLMNEWLPHFRQQTYILCVSEHCDTEDDYGRLSMWRAYGGKHSVAMVFKNHPFLQVTDAFKAYSHPVEYRNSEYIEKRLSEIEARFRANPHLVNNISEDRMRDWLYDTAKAMILCVKHPGFREEKEWRVIYCPTYQLSENVKSSIESLNGVPQQVYKIPLKNIPEENFTGGTIPEMVDRIIIGPSDESPLLGDAFRKLLREAGCEDTAKLVHYSGIPLRPSS